MIIVVLLAPLAAFAGIHQATMPQAARRDHRSAALHLGGEFVESNLGSAVEPDGSVTVRAIGQQYSFTPECMLVPTDTPITFRATSARRGPRLPDRGHQHQHHAGAGLRLRAVQRASKPGEHLMPCQEFCGVGHEGMWAKVKVIDKAEFAKPRRREAEAELC